MHCDNNIATILNAAKEKLIKCSAINTEGKDSQIIGSDVNEHFPTLADSSCFTNGEQWRLLHQIRIRDSVSNTVQTTAH